MRPRSLLLVLAAVASLAACGRCGRTPPPPSVPPQPTLRDAVAVVDGEPIPATALERGLREVTPASGEAVDPAVRRQVLEDLVDRVLLQREARQRKLAPAPEEVERELSRLRSEYPDTRFDEVLAQQGLTADELRTRTRERLAVERLLASVSGAPTVSDEEIARAYQARAAEFEEHLQVHALQILVRTREEADRIRKEVRRKPGSFAEVARRVSIAPDAKQGGDLGWFGKGSGMPAVFDTCLSLPVDRISEVTSSAYGYHLFKVIARRPARRRPLSEVSAALREQLVREKQAAAQAQFLASLRGRAKIELK